MNTLQRRLIALALGLVAACGGGGGGGGGNGGGTSTTTGQPPSDLVYPASTSIYLTDVIIPANIPTFHGTVNQFAVSPPLPTGLSIHPSLGAIYGAASATEPRTVHTVTASNADGSTQFALTITVVAPPRFVYSASEDGTISIFGDDPATGRLRRVGFVPAAAGESGPEKLVIHPTKEFAYVTNLATNNVSVYTIAPISGWLTAGTPVAAGLGQHDMVIDPAGKWAYVSSRISDDVRVYSIDSDTGALTPVGTPVDVGIQPSALALDRTGKYLFVTLHGDPSTGDGSALAVFGVDPMTGAIDPIGTPFSLASSEPRGLTVDRVKNELYLIEEATQTVAALHFDAATGALDSIGDYPMSVVPAGVSGDPSGKFVYVSASDPSDSTGSISVFKVDATSGALTFAGSADCADHPGRIQVDPTGHFAYVAGHDSSDLRQFKIDPQTGELTAAQELVTRAGPVDLAIAQAPHVQDWVPRFAYVANSASGDVSTFGIDPATGNLIEILPTVLTGNTPVSLAADPQERYVYIANRNSGTASIFAPSPTTGVLFEVAAAASLFGPPTHVTVEPSGRFVYITCLSPVDPGAGALLSYAINPVSGSLSLIDNQTIEPNPTWVETDPTGQFLYVACSGPSPSAVRSFRISLTTGIPVSVDSHPAPSVSSLGFHPSGKYLYATLGGVSVSLTIQFTIDTATGGLTPSPHTVASGVEPSGITISPDGRAAYIAYRNTAGHGHVGFFQVDPMNGMLMTPPELTQDGQHPTALTVDPSGKFLYVTNDGTDDVSVMIIDSETGDLTIGTPKDCGMSPAAILVLGGRQ